MNAEPIGGAAGERGCERLRWSHAASLTAVCGLVYFFGLWWRSFASSEGHRVAPAWEMLRTGHGGGWWRVSMFGQTYFRKPPGMPWAIAASSLVLGENEFAARAVSAGASTVEALTAWWFASRWFGARFGIAAGLALALMPQLWSPGRTAEIEALNNLGALLAGFAVIDLVLRGRDASARGRAGAVVAGAAGLVVAGLAKGPAAAPVLAGVVLASAVLRLWTWRAAGAVLAMAAAGAAVLVPVGLRLASANSDALAVTQGAEEFLWTGGLMPVLMLAPMALFAALPASLGMLYPWGREAAGEAAAAGPGAVSGLRAARLLGASWLGSLAVMCAIGIGNPRYAMPAAALLAPMCSFMARGVWGGGAEAPSFGEKRRRLGRRLLLGNPLALPVVLTCAAVLSGYGVQRFRVGIDGREAGEKLAKIVAEQGGAGGTVEVWANGLVEARPDVLLYARRAAAPGLELTPLWKPREMGAGELPRAGAMVVLRVDEGGDERARYEGAIVGGRLAAIGDGEVGRYRFRVFRCGR